MALMLVTLAPDSAVHCEMSKYSATRKSICLRHESSIRWANYRHFEVHENSLGLVEGGLDILSKKQHQG